MTEGGAADPGGAAGRLPHPLRLVRRRQPDRGDGAGRPRPRPRLRGAHRPLAAADRGARLSPERLREQLDVVAEVNERLAPFRLLTGIEVDINEDGSLDQEDELLARLDVVVASVHSKLRMDREAMTARMVAAVANPHTDILGHCTGRTGAGRAGGRPRVDVRRRAGLRGLRRVRHRGRDQLPSRAAGPAPPAAAPRGRDRLPVRASTPTRTRRASSTGSRTAASARRSARCRWTRSSTPSRSTSCSPGPARLARLVVRGIDRRPAQIGEWLFALRQLLSRLKGFG